MRAFNFHSVISRWRIRNMCRTFSYKKIRCYRWKCTRYSYLYQTCILMGRLPGTFITLSFSAMRMGSDSFKSFLRGRRCSPPIRKLSEGSSWRSQGWWCIPEFIKRKWRGGRGGVTMVPVGGHSITLHSHRCGCAVWYYVLTCMYMYLPEGRLGTKSCVSVAQWFILVLFG